MRQKIAAGNWKMNKNYNEAMQLAQEILEADRPNDVLTILACPSIFIAPIHENTHHGDGFEIAAQNCHHELNGAFTGEISAPMIESIGIKYVIVGHSERRQYFGETDDVILKKINVLHSLNMTPIYCCGEPLEIRKQGNHEKYVVDQMANSILNLSADQLLNTIIAYEPIWAIGTGETATPQQAQDMHASIRLALSQKFGQDIADQISILYGGSVKGSNAAELFANPDVDGGLVGGASLQSDEFLKIIRSF